MNRQFSILPCTAIVYQEVEGVHGVLKYGCLKVQRHRFC